MGIFGPPIEEPELLRKASARRRQWGVKRSLPLRTRLLLRMPWLGRAEWWHLVIAIVLIVAAIFGVTQVVPIKTRHRGDLATVNGISVREADITAEAMARNIPATAIDEKMHRLLLQQVIDRKLLVSAATEAGIEDDPTYRANRKRMNEVMAARAIAQRFAGADKEVADADSRAFMAAHPLQFSKRQKIIADTVVTETQDGTVASLMPANSIDEMALALDGRSQKYDRIEQDLDTGVLPAALAARLVQVPLKQMFVLPIGQRVIAGAVLRRVPAVRTDAEQMREARSAVANQKSGNLVEQALGQLRKKADIRVFDGGR